MDEFHIPQVGDVFYRSTRPDRAEWRVTEVKAQSDYFGESWWVFSISSSKHRDVDLIRPSRLAWDRVMIWGKETRQGDGLW